jgi:hypothetical protein
VEAIWNHSFIKVMELVAGMAEHLHEALANTNDCYWPILLKKSASGRAAFQQLKNRSILALLRKNQDSYVV